MYGEVDASGGERFFDLFRKHALGADFGESDVGNFVAGGVDDLDFNFVAACAQKRGDVVRLPKGKLRAAGADAEFGWLGIGVVHFARVRGLGGSGISMNW